MFCHVATEQVVGVHDVSSVYHVPLLLQAQGIVDFFTKRLGLDKLGVDGRTSPSLGESPHATEILNGLHTAINGLSLGKDVKSAVRSGGEAQERIWEARRAKGRELGIKWRDLTKGYLSLLRLFLFLYSHRLTDFFHSQERLFDKVTIALVGKYTDLKDSYMSVTKALEHSAFRVHRKLTIQVCFRFPFFVYLLRHVFSFSFTC